MVATGPSGRQIWGYFQRFVGLLWGIATVLLATWLSSYKVAAKFERGASAAAAGYWSLDRLRLGRFEELDRE